MDPGLVVLALLCAGLTGAMVIMVVVVVRGQRQLSEDLAASREQVSALQRRLDAPARQLDDRPVQPGPDFEITTVSQRQPPGAALEVADQDTLAPLGGRAFASVAVWESLVTVFSFGYGVRRALSAETRNRIGFEMRREVRRARKQRRRELKEAKRTHRRADLDQDAA
ncbi:MAG: hypothetical protein ACR2HA_01715 [Nocardioides sp.]